jgi:methionyl-tRNA synthetase
MSKFFITTAIDYPNSLPHIGTAFEKLGADAQARFQRMTGNEVRFLMGNDENTLKVAERAKKLNKDPQAYCDEMAIEFRKVWDLLGISYDAFIQTTSPEHKAAVTKFITIAERSGAIYKKQYKAPYCAGCEEFKTGKSLVDGKCPNHQTLDIVQVEEENYFFRLSDPRFKEVAKNFLVNVRPQVRANEVEAFLEEIEDISISRRNQGWGIPIPWDESQVIYVWFDALINYLTGAGFGNNEEMFLKWWPADAHIIGKDITRFHCIFWPAMIAAYNIGAEQPIAQPHIALPSKVFGHGFIQTKGEKISKSGTFIDPTEIVSEYGRDAYRYYFLAKCSFGSDGDYDPQHFKEVYNSDLANNLGNLLSRVHTLVRKFGTAENSHNEKWAPPLPRNSTWIEKTCFYHYRDALQLVWNLLTYINTQIEENKPWDKTIESTPSFLRWCCMSLRIVSIYLKPYLPDTAEKVYKAFNWKDEWEKLTWDQMYKIIHREYDTEGKIEVTSEKLEPLFPRKK